MSMTTMYRIDAALLLVLCGLLITIAQKDYPGSRAVPRALRAALYCGAVFAFCSATHILGILPRTLAAAYWARIALDACLVAAAAARVVYGRFFPAPPRETRPWCGRWGLSPRK